MRTLILTLIAVGLITLAGLAGNVDPDEYLVYDIKRANPDMSSDQIRHIMGLPRYGNCMMIDEDVVKPMRGEYLWVNETRSAAAVMSVSPGGCVVGNLLFENLETKK